MAVNGPPVVRDAGSARVVYCRVSTIRDDFLSITIGQRSTYGV